MLPSVDTLEDLRSKLRGMDGRGYPAYKQLMGEWRGEYLDLRIDHAQGDPFATPSRLSVLIPEEVHALPASLRSSAVRRRALSDYLTRVFSDATDERSRRRGSGNSGQIHVCAGLAEILERSACEFIEGDLLLRFRAGLPANGRRIAGDAAARLLTDTIPRAATRLHWD